MKTVSYSPEFIEAIKLAKEKGLFLGTGNPNANILFLGKEAAIDKEKSAQQHEREFLKNIADWDYNNSTNNQFTHIDNWITSPSPIFNSLYPYKGQRNTINRKKTVQNQIIYNGGTSKTWYNYQKIIDAIYFNNIPSNLINFHEYAFCSELNQETGRYSNDIPKNKRANSIEKRKELFDKPFFKEFPITIVAVGHYVRDFDIDLQDIFKKTFHEALSQEHSQGLKSEYLNIHFDNPEKPTQLLIHTNQLSMVSNELIRKLGEVCTLFLNGKINL